MKKLISIILAAILVVSVFSVCSVIVSAGYSYSHYADEFNSYYQRENERLKQQAEEQKKKDAEFTSDKEFKNDNSSFTVNSPSINGKYAAGQPIELSVTPKVFYFTYYSGIQVNSPNTIVMNISKNGELKKKFTASYYNNDLEKKITDSFTPTEAGTYEVNIKYKGSDMGSYKITVKSLKKNPIKLKAKSQALSASKLKIAAQKLKKYLKVKKAKGKLTYSIVKKGTTKKLLKKISINKSTGVIKFKKGAYAKKTYKVKVNVSAAGNTKYNPGSKSVVVKVKIK
jgi:hypothetical protein